MLSRCIAVDPDTFAKEYWGRQPLHSNSASLPRDFDDLLTAGMVDELLAERGVRAPFIRMARDGGLLARDSYVGPQGFGAEMPDQVDSAKVLAEFGGGATIVLQGLHRLWPPVIDFVRGMVDDLGHPVQANAYITPASNRGFDPHYDVHDVFVLQTAGRKRWTIHAPVHRDPLSSQPWTDHRTAVSRRARDEPVLDVVPEPGDALYLPRGWIHSAQALGETSVHLTIGVSPVTVRDVLAAIVEEAGSIDDLRASLPLGIDVTDRDDTAAVVRTAMATVVDEWQNRAGSWAIGAADALATRHADRTRPEAVRPLATVDAADSLTAETVVRWRRGLVGEVVPAGERVELRLPDRTVGFPSFCGEALSRIVTGSAVSADQLPGLDAADGTVVLRRLLREAVVVPLHADGPSEAEQSTSMTGWQG
ncbi:cupin domain-containing protein [Gordonia sp. OPL2]|uniref:cupin domain-containing protein n=1 Tax=Gordonia sp. OPL2 TaxID=2486274 RepID=UPI0016557A9D|nr:cupin domain-containing protein [Gordonia sp. OPL2]ROZ88847.1 cupin [Gordonia sp. OPL2]